ALAFAEAGAAVSLCARGQVALDEAARALAAYGGQVHAQACDLGEPAAIEAWSANFNVDLMAAVRASRAALPHLAASPRACILHTSSIAALHPRKNGPAYAAMKAALSHYTTSQALQLAEQRIRVNAIAPGSIEFADGLWDRRRHDEPELYAAT